MESASGNRRRAAGGGHVIGHRLATRGRKAIWIDFCGGAEKSWARGRDGSNRPPVLQYRTEIAERSLFHTPPMFAVYIVGLMVEWIEAEGGVEALEERNN